MKKQLLILCLGCTVNLAIAQEQQNNAHSIQDSHHTVLGYINGGTITDAKNAFLGDFKASANGQAAVSDRNHKIIGYVVQGTEVQDANHKTLGFMMHDGA